MLNRSANLAMSTCVLKALPGKLDIKRHSPSILYVFRLFLAAFKSSRVCDVFLWFLSLSPYGVLGQVCYLIVSIPALCLLSYFLKIIKIHIICN